MLLQELWYVALIFVAAAVWVAMELTSIFKIGLFLFLLILIFLFFLWRKRRSSYVPHCEIGVVDTILVVRQMDGVVTQHDSLYASATVPSRECVWMYLPQLSLYFSTLFSYFFEPIHFFIPASNPPIMMSTSLPPPWPNAQEWVPNPEHPTTELRPFHPDSMISQSGERNLPLSAPTSFAIPDVSPPYPIPLDLTQEDARFFNDLYALNVPAANIATMMETLRAGRMAANANRMEGSSSSGAIRIEPEVVDMVPPQYDSKDSR